jgi:hypothetical protein
MKPEQLEQNMRIKCQADVEFASLTWAERSQQLRCREQMRKTMGIIFAIVGLTCGVGGLADTFLLVVFGILGPILLRYDTLFDLI